MVIKVVAIAFAFVENTHQEFQHPIKTWGENPFVLQLFDEVQPQKAKHAENFHKPEHSEVR
jgi:hypothetical protein